MNNRVWITRSSTIITRFRVWIWVDKSRSVGPEDVRVTRFLSRRLFVRGETVSRSAKFENFTPWDHERDPSWTGGISMKAGYDRLLLVFLRTVSASIRITPPPFFKQQSLLFSSLSSRFRYCSATVSRSPLPDEDDLFRRHAKLSRLLFHRFLAPLSNIELCILLFSSQTLFAIFLKNFPFAMHSSSKSSRTLLRFLKRFSSRRRNLSWKTLGEIEHIYIKYISWRGRN